MMRLFAALYASEPTYSYWNRTGSVWAKARSTTVFDRIITGEEHRLTVNGQPLRLDLDEVAK